MSDADVPASGVWILCRRDYTQPRGRLLRRYKLANRAIRAAKAHAADTGKLVEVFIDGERIGFAIRDYWQDTDPAVSNRLETINTGD